MTLAGTRGPRRERRVCALRRLGAAASHGWWLPTLEGGGLAPPGKHRGLGATGRLPGWEEGRAAPRRRRSAHSACVQERRASLQCGNQFYHLTTHK